VEEGNAKKAFVRGAPPLKKQRTITLSGAVFRLTFSGYESFGEIIRVITFKIRNSGPG
jgi:hypothetical protein